MGRRIKKGLLTVLESYLEYRRKLAKHSIFRFITAAKAFGDTAV